MKNVFIIGARGYTKNYGGWETFVHGLIDNWKNDSIKFTVFEISNKAGDDKTIREVNGVKCITLYVAQTGSSAMVRFDYAATKYAYNYVVKNKVNNPVFFYLGLRIGPYIWLKKNRFRKANIKLIENPAGLEWKRTKWNKLVQLYSYFSAKMMASSMDCLICDNGGILDAYNRFKCCKKIKKYCIAYGTYERKPISNNLPKCVIDYYAKFNIEPNNYYLVLGRLVPENNYGLMLSEMTKYKGNKKFLIICNTSKELKYFQKLEKKYHISQNQNIVFAGELYDQVMLSYIRQNAFAYIHGHSVGGTNPGLLEAMSNTNLNILFDCVFNKEVGKDTALYFNKNKNSLIKCLAKAESLSKEDILIYGEKARENMKKNYSWDLIDSKYSEMLETL